MLVGQGRQEAGAESGSVRGVSGSTTTTLEPTTLPLEPKPGIRH
ncbi:MAG: hypothetical protein QOI89_1194 [Solirubrobacteraceae bacterium]|nr:hypothetical protein [Solirubrobacteraceae bacterium]